MTTEPTGGSPRAPSRADDGVVPDDPPAGIAGFRDVHQIFNHTYLSGLYFVVNAVPDVRLLFDGPSCGYDKAFLLAGTHDLFSRLFQFPGRHRICCTHVQADALVHDRTQAILRLLGEVLRAGGQRLILVAAMPMASITGIDYQAIIDQAATPDGVDVVLVPDKSFRSDWIEGYDEALCTLADRLVPEPAGRPHPEDVAVVGYLLDRHEGDHRGNLEEIERVARALSLNLVSVWLDGSSTAELARVAQAGTIVSLPYGRRAAQRIAERTGAQVLPLDLPIGLGPSRAWISALGAATGRRWEARELIDQQLRDAVPVLDLVTGDYLQGKRFAVNGDPFLGEALFAAFEEVGCIADHAVLFAVEAASERLARRHQTNARRLHCVRLSEVLELELGGVDFVIGNSYVHYLVRLRHGPKPYVELGYPSYKHHCLTSRPTWFFRGFVELVNRVVNAL